MVVLHRCVAPYACSDVGVGIEEVAAVVRREVSITAGGASVFTLVEPMGTHAPPVLAGEHLDEPPAKRLAYRGLQLGGQVRPVDLFHHGQITGVQVDVLGALEHR